MVLHEEGEDVVAAALQTEGAVVSSVNLSEVIARLSDLTAGNAQVAELIQPLRFQTAVFDRTDAWRAGLLRTATRSLGLSFGDRACLALAQRLELPVLTADRLWTSLDVGVEIVLCR